MLDAFEQFVAELGSDAAHYTPDELRQLHMDVFRLAEFLIDVDRAQQARKKQRRSPQGEVDAAQGDRIIERSETSLTPCDDAEVSSADPP